MKKEVFTIRTIRLKLFLLACIVLLPSFLLMGYEETRTIAKIIQGEALVKAQSDLNTGMTIINQMYPGNWHVTAGKLYKGKQLMNGDYALVDEIGRLTNGDTDTLFLKDVRVDTNVMANGQRAVNTLASAPIIHTVLDDGKVFIGRADVVGHTYQSAYTPIRDAKGKIIGMWYVGAPDANVRIQHIERETAWKIAFTAGVILIVALLLNFFLSRPIVRRIRDASCALRKVAQGDLTINELKVTSKDETGVLLEALNHMVVDLKEIFLKIKTTSVTLASSAEELSMSSEQSAKAAEQIAEATQQVAAGSEEQMRTVQDVTISLNQMSNGIEQISNNSQEVALLAQKASLASETGLESVHDVLEQMNQIYHTTEKTSEMMTNVHASSHEIGSIVSMITNISDQTNLLALNAAIEAARAGDAGRGFAVVAGEVRKLAEQSAQSASEIRKLIDQIQGETEGAVASMKQEMVVVQDGQIMTAQLSDLFDKIQQSVVDVAHRVKEVSAAAGDLSSGSQFIVQAMSNVSHVAVDGTARIQQTSAANEEQLATMEEISSSAESLSTLAMNLQNMLSHFNV